MPNREHLEEVMIQVWNTLEDELWRYGNGVDIRKKIADEYTDSIIDSVFEYADRITKDKKKRGNACAKCPSYKECKG
jgi:hypothetical protein